jgi:hypothetical protein
MALNLITGDNKSSQKLLKIDFIMILWQTIQYRELSNEQIGRSKVELVLSYGSQFSEFIFIFTGSEF